jgi:hypothetical protein
MGSAFALWLMLAAEPLPMDWCLGTEDSGATMEVTVCEFFEEQTHVARLGAAYAALREAVGAGDAALVNEAEAAFWLDRDRGCAVWAGTGRGDPWRLTPSLCGMRRLFQRIEEVEEQLRSLR